MITSNVAECGGFLKTDPNLAVPDIQLHFSMAMADNHGRNRRLGHGFGCHVCLLRPKSRGTRDAAERRSRGAAAHRSEILRSPRGSRGDGQGVQDHPADHGCGAAGEMADAGNVQRRRQHRRRDPHRAAQPLRHRLPSGRNRPHGHRRGGGGRSAIAGERASRACGWWMPPSCRP